VDYFLLFEGLLIVLVVACFFVGMAFSHSVYQDMIKHLPPKFQDPYNARSSYYLYIFDADVPLDIPARHVVSLTLGSISFLGATILGVLIAEYRMVVIGGIFSAFVIMETIRCWLRYKRIRGQDSCSGNDHEGRGGFS
jgi:hypothetical protein